MNNFAHAPWGWMFLFSWLVRVPFALIILGMGVYNEGSRPTGIIYFVVTEIETMLSGVELATFGCWIAALIIRRKLRGRGPDGPAVED